MQLAPKHSLLHGWRLGRGFGIEGRMVKVGGESVITSRQMQKFSKMMLIRISDLRGREAAVHPALSAPTRTRPVGLHELQHIGAVEDTLITAALEGKGEM